MTEWVDLQRDAGASRYTISRALWCGRCLARKVAEAIVDGRLWP